MSHARSETDNLGTVGVATDKLWGPTKRSLQERARIVLAFTRMLYVNGQSTDEIVAATARLGAV